MMYSAMDVANYVINFSVDSNEEITNLKLQKLLYYIDAAFLVKKGESCIFQNFKRWRHGPVIPDVYSKFRVYLNTSIPRRDENPEISLEDRNLINTVIESNFKFDPWELVDRTHKETPWLETASNDVIDKNVIKNYFLNGHSNRIYGEI